MRARPYDGTCRGSSLTYLYHTMAIDISRSHHMDKATTRRVVEKIATSLGQSLHFTYTWHEDRLTFERIGVKGYIDIADHRVRVFVRKSPLLPVTEDWIRQQVETSLDKYIANGEA